MDSSGDMFPGECKDHFLGKATGAMKATGSMDSSGPMSPRQMYGESLGSLNDTLMGTHLEYEYEWIVNSVLNLTLILNEVLNSYDNKYMFYFSEWKTAYLTLCNAS